VRPDILQAWNEACPGAAARAQAAADVSAAFGASVDSLIPDAQLGLHLLAAAPALPDVSAPEVVGAARWRALRRLCEVAPDELSARAALAFANADAVQTTGDDPSVLHYPAAVVVSAAGLSGRGAASARELTVAAERCRLRDRGPV
jgi:hypothetical protein